MKLTDKSALYQEFHKKLKTPWVMNPLYIKGAIGCGDLNGKKTKKQKNGKKSFRETWEASETTADIKILRWLLSGFMLQRLLE